MNDSAWTALSEIGLAHRDDGSCLTEGVTRYLLIDCQFRLFVCYSAHLPSSADRKSTRLNSSHGYISYAVFCLKKTKHLVPLPGYETFTQVGLQGELHYATLMLLGSGQAAKFFLWSNCLCIAGMLSAVGKNVDL